TVNLNRVVVDKNVLRLLPVELARRFPALPISREGQTITVALADPFNVVAIDALNQATGLNIEVVTAPARDILNYLDLYYTTGDNIDESIEKILEDKAESAAFDLDHAIEELESGDEDIPVIRLVTQIITRAVKAGASDIHFEPEENLMRIRTRLDGILLPELLIPKAMQSPVTTRWKILAD